MDGVTAAARRGWCLVCVVALLSSSVRGEEVVNNLAGPPASEAAAPATLPAEHSWTSTELKPVSSEQAMIARSPCSNCQSGCTCGPNCSCGSQSNCESCPLFGCIKPSDQCFSDFISPLTNPLFFEDPRTLTEIRPIFANHWIPDSNPVYRGGDVQYLAAQLRIALTERLSIIATKDGFIWIDSNNEDVAPDTDGWADVAAGLKYNLVRDPATQFLVSAGMTFELDAGEHQVYQGQGDGEFHFFGTAGKGLGERAHWISGAGYRQPTDTTKRSAMFYWSNHLDYEVIDTWYGLVEVNWFHWTKSGELLGVDFEGGDLFNLGATNVAGNDVVTMGVGGRKRFGKMNELGCGYEFPLTERKDLFGGRIYADLIVRF